LWPVIGGLLRKDPRERLSSAEAEPMLLSALATPGRAAAALSAAEAGSAQLRRRRLAAGATRPELPPGARPGAAPSRGHRAGKRARLLPGLRGGWRVPPTAAGRENAA
jgi:hypothetical protein